MASAIQRLIEVARVVAGACSLSATSVFSYCTLYHHLPRLDQATFLAVSIDLPSLFKEIVQNISLHAIVRWPLRGMVVTLSAGGPYYELGRSLLGASPERSHWKSSGRSIGRFVLGRSRGKSVGKARGNSRAGPWGGPLQGCPFGVP